jgi:hypothetical protein
MTPAPADSILAPGRRTAARLLLAIYLATFLLVSVMWIRQARVRRWVEPFPPRVGWRIGFRPYGLGAREWSGPVPVSQISDPLVRDRGPNAGGSSSSHGDRLFGIVTVGRGHLFAGGIAYTYRDWYVPYYVLWWVTLPAPLLVLREIARCRRCRPAAGAGRCAGCGYDLRATPDRCPECCRHVNPAARRAQ